MAQISSYVDPDLGQALINNNIVETDTNVSPDVPTPEEETEIIKDIAAATPDDSVIAEITQKDEDNVSEAPVAETEQPKVFSAMNKNKNKKTKK
jgi:hypothetical protein